MPQYLKVYYWLLNYYQLKLDNGLLQALKKHLEYQKWPLPWTVTEQPVKKDEVNLEDGGIGGIVNYEFIVSSCVIGNMAVICL